MIAAFDDHGNLPPGEHEASWPEILARFGGTPRRKWLLTGIFRGVCALAAVGCRGIYLGGSFVTSKSAPIDYDACYELAGMDLVRLRATEPSFFDFRNGRAAQKLRFCGEWFPAQATEGQSGRTFLAFFQQDKETGSPRGIVHLEVTESAFRSTL